MYLTYTWATEINKIEKNSGQLDIRATLRIEVTHTK